jgi:hypothetical protein
MSIRNPLLLGVLAILAVFSAHGQGASVAKVAVSVGEARKFSPTGQSELLQVGSPLMAGDRVRTGPDAVAILVFADEGRISLRADSELWIRHYEIDPSGVRTRIELELVKGTVRQISGNASRTQPDRYRLNTPIAVIGVRGTDFLAKTSGDAVEAFVHEGKIVLIPSLTECAGASTANCQSIALASSSTAGSKYVRLSATGQVENREFKPGELEKVFGIELARATRPQNGSLATASAPEFRLPAGSQFVTDTIFVAYGQGSDASRLPAIPMPTAPLPAAGQDPVGSSSSSTGGALGGVATAGTSSSASAGSPTVVQEGVAASLPAVTPVAPLTPPAPATPPVAVVAAPDVAPPPPQLVWGRFSSASALPVALTLPFSEAQQGRHVTVGELGQYALWRANPSGAMDASLRGKADFALAGAEAVLVGISGVSAALVTAATLSVDFDHSTFFASVGLHHETTGSAALAVNGRVNEEGVFVGLNATDRVAGALTRNGKEAGYLFSKDVSAGTFRGITLWGRK